jgi:cell division protein ZapA
MAQVSLQINGFGYILGCADGEEEHLRALAADLDRRIEEIKASSGPGGESRLLLMAALVLSDELHEIRERDAPSGPAPKSEPKIGRRLRGIAKRAEAIAESTEALPLAKPPEPLAEPSAPSTEPSEHVVASPEPPATPPDTTS